MTEAGDESSEDEELLACCFVNINLDSKAKCARFGYTVSFQKFIKFSVLVWSGVQVLWLSCSWR